MQSSKKVSFHTLGCKLNFAETSTIARQFTDGGYLRCQSARDADICIINTCSVTEHADKKCRNLVRKLHRENPDAIIAVTGCYAQLKPGDLASIEGVDLVINNNNKADVYQKVRDLSAERSGAVVYSCDTSEITNFFAAFSSGDRTRAFLKVQDGCDYKCTYCTIHNARGSSRNIAIKDVVDEANKIIGLGVKEIVLTGINTGDFGKSTDESFIDLLRALDRINEPVRYRISSIEPNLLTDEVIALCGHSDKFMPHFHVPLQSGSNSVLARMRRRYTAEKFEQRIAAVRKLIPDAFIGIDVIVGFPGETEEDFKSSYDLLHRIKPAHIHVFPYSERENTPAALYDNKVRDLIKTNRAKLLGELSERLHNDFYLSNLGSTREVLLESNRKSGYVFGFTDNYVKVKVPYDSSLINNNILVHMDEVDMDGIVKATVI